MEIKIDLKDKKILHELDKNSRIPSSQIAKKVGLSSEAVNYRIKKLEKEEIITQYQLIINLAKLDIIQFKICLALQYIKEEQLKLIINKLKKNNAVKWIVSSKGNWDLILSLETNSLEKIDNLKNNILELFKGSIREKAISILVEAETYPRNYLLDEKNLTSSRTIMKKDSIVKLDDVDSTILKELTKNARISLVDLAEKLKSTPRIINYRIKQLEKKRVILGYKIAIDYEKLGIRFFKLFIYLGKAQEEKIKSLVDYFINHKNIIHNVRVIGNWDFEPEIEVYSEEKFDEILVELKEEFSEIIQKIDIITISKEHKFVYF